MLDYRGTSLLVRPGAYAHGYDFDPGYGMDMAQLLSIAPPQSPDDFADFWKHRYVAAMSVSPRPRLRETGQMMGEHVVRELRYASTSGVEIGGWLLVPRDGKVSRGLVIGHGYNGREAPDEPLEVAETVLLFPCFRGLGCSALANVSHVPYRHVLHGIEDRDRYILGGCVEDLWLAVSAMLELFPAVSGRVGCSGISFSGGIAALASPWDDRIQRLHLQVPTFGHHALRLTLPCIGSSESVRAFQRHSSFNVMETLAYYDAASAAQRLSIPTLVAVAQFDPAVPPPGQFAICNAIPERFRRLFVLDAGHFDYPGQSRQAQELRRLLVDFFMEL